MRQSFRLAALLAAFAAASGAALAQEASPDPFRWLEDVHGARSMDWVRGQNAATAAVLEHDARYETFRREALAIFTAQDRIALPRLRAGGVDNFWQDSEHRRGLWRRTTLAGYRAADPHWRTVLDIDALARAEGKDWYWKGATCLEPDETLCLVHLSLGGKDAVTLREFDATTGRFVAGGFELPEGKQNVDWLDRDTLVAARDWGPGTLTASGYPFVVKVVRRGEPLSATKEIFRGQPGDVQDGARLLRSPQGKVEHLMFDRGVSFFEREYYASAPRGPVRLPLPLKSDIRAYLHHQLVFSIQQDWNGFRSGDLLAYDADALFAQGPAPQPVLVARPAANQSIEAVEAAGDALIVTGLEDVKGFADAYAFRDGRWSARRLPLPRDMAISIVDASPRSARLFLETQGFLAPTALWLADSSRGEAERLKALPPRFDATREVVEQFWAASSDGVRIPYFVVHRRSQRLDGSTPTIMYGYGGFQLSKPPAYLPEVGKLWLERGGAYVIANIRGGGEFGPRWHQAALRENRQRAFDDFAAVARDLFARKITSPRRLGIYGRSNGGVLMSVSMTQHPELFRAVVVESPLVDMLRYNHLSAGASWVGEYGDPDIPADRAFIARYSAYQALKPGVAYPKALITTNTEDDRVHPSHARKFAARLQALGDPYLYYEDSFGGHSYDADPAANAARWARFYTYMAQQLMD